MKKVVLFAFNGEPMCFVHVLLNGLDMKDKGYDVRVVVEGAATKLVPEISREGNQLHGLYKKARDFGIIAGACKACSVKTGVAEEVLAEGIPLLDDMSGHPSMVRYQMQGFDVITF